MRTARQSAERGFCFCYTKDLVFSACDLGFQVTILSLVIYCFMLPWSSALPGGIRDLRYIHAMHQVSSCNYHQHLSYYRYTVAATVLTWCRLQICSYIDGVCYSKSDELDLVVLFKTHTTHGVCAVMIIYIQCVWCAMGFTSKATVISRRSQSWPPRCVSPPMFLTIIPPSAHCVISTLSKVPPPRSKTSTFRSLLLTPICLCWNVHDAAPQLRSHHHRTWFPTH